MYLSVFSPLFLSLESLPPLLLRSGVKERDGGREEKLLALHVRGEGDLAPHVLGEGDGEEFLYLSWLTLLSLPYLLSPLSFSLVLKLLPSLLSLFW